MTAFTTPCDLFYNRATNLVWMADAGVGVLYAFTSSTRSIWMAATFSGAGSGAYLFSAGIGTESSQSSIVATSGAARTASLTGAGFNGVSRLVGDNVFLYATNSAGANPNLLAIVNQATGAVVGLCNVGAGNLAMDQVPLGDNLWVAAQASGGGSGNVLLFSITAAIAAYPAAITPAVTSATSRSYSAIAYDPTTTNIFAGTTGQGGGEVLASLNSVTLADIATKSFGSSLTFSSFQSLLSSSDGSIRIGTGAGGVQRITPSTFPGASAVVVTTAGLGLSHHLFEDTVDSTIVVGDDVNMSGGNNARVRDTGTPAMVSSWRVPGVGLTGAKAALITTAPSSAPTQWVAYKSLDTSQIVTQKWLAGSTYATNARIVPLASPTGYFYQCTTAGVAGATEPTWPTLPGATVKDGGAVWTCSATTSPLLTVGQTITVQGENSSSLEQVTVLAVSPTPQGYASSGPCFLASFLDTHDAGATIVTGPFPYWWSTSRTLVVVLTAAAAADRETRRKVDEFLRKAAKTYDQWAICGAISTTVTGGTIGGVSAGNAMGTQPLADNGPLAFTNTT